MKGANFVSRETKEKDIFCVGCNCLLGVAFELPNGERNIKLKPHISKTTLFCDERWYFRCPRCETKNKVDGRIHNREFV